MVSPEVAEITVMIFVFPRVYINGKILVNGLQVVRWVFFDSVFKGTSQEFFDQKRQKLAYKGTITPINIRKSYSNQIFHHVVHI